MIQIFDNRTCVKCGERCKAFSSYKIDKAYEWCKSCETNYLKNNFTNWTSGNEKIDNLIQKMQLKISNYNDIIFEWIPYDQFNDVKEMCKDDFATIMYSATWKDAPLEYDPNIMRYLNRRVALK
jgi:hypothetical protein